MSPTDPTKREVMPSGDITQGKEQKKNSNFPVPDMTLKSSPAIAGDRVNAKPETTWLQGIIRFISIIWQTIWSSVYRLVSMALPNTNTPRGEFRVKTEITPPLASAKKPLSSQNYPLAEAGTRTLAMKELLQLFPNYNHEKKVLEIKGEEYIPLTGTTRDISKSPIASCGGNLDREVLLLDPKNSPLLDKHVHKLSQELIKLIEGGQSEREVLKALHDYIRREIFPSCKSLTILEDTDAYLEKCKKNFSINLAETPILFIPLDEFIKAGNTVGVCRHHALATVYILDKLAKKKKPIIRGEACHVRSEVPGGAHVWAAFKTKQAVYHIDTLWNVFGSLSDEKFYAQLIEKYGKEALERQSRVLRREVSSRSLI